MPYPYRKAFRYPKGMPLSEFYKLAWKEQPVVTGGFHAFFAFLFYDLYKVKQYYSIPKADIKRYKLTYTVYRPDDPRVANIKQ